MTWFRCHGYLVVFAVLLIGTADADERSELEMAVGKKLYTAKCARCHKFYDPAAYSDEQWSEWMGKMRKKARLKQDQYEILSRYLDSFRGKRGPTESSAAPN